MKRRALALGFSLLLFAAMPGASLASTYTVDQTQTVNDNSFGASNPIFAQTFTDGLYGTLDSVDIYMYGHPATASVSLQGVTGSPAVPDGTIMASKTLGVNSPDPGWVRFDFTTNPILVPGHKYALFIYVTGSLNSMYGSTADSYSGGQALMFYASAWHYLPDLYTGAPADLAFKTNVGLAPATPTPVPAATPTPRPTPRPTPAPSHSSTPTASVAPSAVSSTAGETATPDAAATPESTSSALAVAASGDPGSSAAPAAPGSQSGGTGQPPIAILGVGLLILILLAGGLVFMLKRRGQASS
jgi:hypothetical protein